MPKLRIVTAATKRVAMPRILFLDALCCDSLIFSIGRETAYRIREVVASFCVRQDWRGYKACVSVSTRRRSIKQLWLCLWIVRPSSWHYWFHTGIVYLNNVLQKKKIKRWSGSKNSSVLCSGVHIFSENVSNIQILGIRRVTWSNINKIVSRAYWRPGFVHFCHIM